MPLIILALIFVVGATILTGMGSPRIPPSPVVLIATLIIMILFGVLLQDSRLSRFKRTFFDVIALTAVSLFAVHIFLGPDIPLTHDLQFAHFPAMAVTKTQSGAGLLPRWTHLLWCGVPFSRVYAPFLFYLSAVLAFLNPVNTARLTFFLAYFLSSLTMYFSNRSLFKNRTAGLVSAICYLLFGYHLIDSNVRGNPPETFAFVWIPLVFFFAMKVLGDEVLSRRLLWASLCSISIAMTFWTHLLSGFMVTVWVAVLPFANLLRKSTSSRERAGESACLMLAIVFGLCSSAWILSPVLFEKDLFLIGRYNTGFWSITNHFVGLENFFIRKTWYERWLSSPQWPMYLGNSILFLALCAVFFMKSEKDTRLRMGLTFLTLTSLGCILFSSDLARPLGELIVKRKIPVLSLATYLQFPWRSLLLCAFSVSSLSGYTLASILSRIPPSSRSGILKKAILSATIVLILLDMFPYTGAVNMAPAEPPQRLVSAVEWLSRQEGIFRVYYCGQDFENPYWYLCGAGYALPTLPPGGAFREWSTVRSDSIINSALAELAGARRLVRAGYLSVKYVVTSRSDLDRWLSGSSVRIAQYFGEYVVLENLLFRPFIEISASRGKMPPGSLTSSVMMRRFDPEKVEFDISFSGYGGHYAIVKESYFSAWSATVNGKPSQVETTQDGLMAIPIQAAFSTISLSFGETPAEKIGRAITLAAAVGIAFVLLASMLDLSLSKSQGRGVGFASRRVNQSSSISLAISIVCLLKFIFDPSAGVQTIGTSTIL